MPERGLLIIGKCLGSNAATHSRNVHYWQDKCVCGEWKSLPPLRCHWARPSNLWGAGHHFRLYTKCGAVGVWTRAILRALLILKLPWEVKRKDSSGNKITSSIMFILSGETCIWLYNGQEESKRSIIIITIFFSIFTNTLLLFSGGKWLLKMVHKKNRFPFFSFPGGVQLCSLTWWNAWLLC